MAVDPAVAEYLRLMREGGHTPEQAREKLLEAGWDSAAVDGAFDQPQPSKRFQALFFHPDEFFARVQGVTSHSALLKDLALFGAVAAAAGPRLSSRCASLRGSLHRRADGGRLHPRGLRRCGTLSCRHPSLRREGGLLRDVQGGSLYARGEPRLPDYLGNITVHPQLP